MSYTDFEAWRDETLQDIWDFMVEFEWSYAEMARHAKVQATTVSKLRKGHTKEPRASTLFKLAQSLGLRLFVSRQNRRKRKSA